MKLNYNNPKKASSDYFICFQHKKNQKQNKTKSLPTNPFLDVFFFKEKICPLEWWCPGGRALLGVFLVKLLLFLYPSMDCFHIWPACVSHRVHILRGNLLCTYYYSNLFLLGLTRLECQVVRLQGILGSNPSMSTEFLLQLKGTENESINISSKGRHRSEGLLLYAAVIHLTLSGPKPNLKVSFATNFNDKLA